MGKRLKEMDRSLKVKSIMDKLHTSGVSLDKVLDLLKKKDPQKAAAGLKGGGMAGNKGGRTKLWRGGPHNTGRMNLLEQEGRIRAEPQTRNVRAEEARVTGELNRGYKGGGAAVRGFGRAFTNAKKV